MRLFVPAGLVAFACGLAMAYLVELLSELWIWIGIAGFAVTFLTGAAVIRPRAEKLLALIRSGGAAADVFGPGREIIAIAKFDYVMLFTIVSDMVLKPGPTDTAVTRPWPWSLSATAWFSCDRCSRRAHPARPAAPPRDNRRRLKS